jgi:hypothetical protein
MSLWSRSILRSRADDEEDEQPFSLLDEAVELDLGKHLGHRSPGTGTVVAIPLSNIPSQRNQDPTSIKVDNSWDVKYSHRE